MSGKKGMPKKKGFGDFIIFLVIALLMAAVGVWGGYVVQETAHKNGKADFERALDRSGDYVNAESFFNAVTAAINGKGYARKGAMYFGLSGLLIFAYQISKTPKRYHRKGEEHGSARWGTDKEKAIVGDVNDFYNNVILAADVLLVLDRKKRDENALTEKEKAKMQRDKNRKEEAEKKRIENLEREISDFIGERKKEDENE